MFSTLSLRRALKVLNAILKEISSMKMMTGIKTMGEVCPQVALPLLRSLSLDHEPTTWSLAHLLLSTVQFSVNPGPITPQSSSPIPGTYLLHYRSGSPSVQVPYEASHLGLAAPNEGQ